MVVVIDDDEEATPLPIKRRKTMCLNCREPHLYRSCPYYRKCSVSQCHKAGIIEAVLCERCLVEHPKCFRDPKQHPLLREQKMDVSFRRPSCGLKSIPIGVPSDEGVVMRCDMCGEMTAKMLVSVMSKVVDFKHNPYSMCVEHYEGKLKKRSKEEVNIPMLEPILLLPPVNEHVEKDVEEEVDDEEKVKKKLSVILEVGTSSSSTWREIIQKTQNLKRKYDELMSEKNYTS